MRTKIVLPGSQEFGETQAQIIKASSRGLVGDDLRSFIKRAGTKVADVMKKLSFADGEVPIHLIAIGAYEHYSINRNGDGFDENTCQKQAWTFEKHARWYYNHQNKDPNKSYGIVKKAIYNDKMHRLELIVALNGTKEAAERNKGLVADKTLNLLASKNGIDKAGVSMACKVAHDVCLACGNNARTRDEYCTSPSEGGFCKAGGCKNNMCRVNENGSIVGVLNPDADWFDISDVSDTRPADRLAFVLGKLQD